ncbi:MAG TPA: FkbM family methyltransferase [Roseiflexaceae bacterium]|nr:FkbM family methyltransferase [Roseiflexaceae bacterium]
MSIIDTLRFITEHPLNQHRKFRALGRFLKWQIGSRLVPGQVIFDWVNGAKIIVSRGETGLTGNIYCGLHEFADMAYILHVLTPEDLFIDVGANVGSYTILACAAKGAKAYCFEPISSTFARLMNNIRLNDLTERVKAMNIGISDEEAEMTFTVANNCANHAVLRTDIGALTTSARVLPLDRVIPNESPSVIKIDVEGFEGPVLKGASSVLRKESLHSVIIELNGSGKRYGFNEESIIRTMIEHGFSAYRYNPFDREILRLAGKNDQSGNTLFIRNERIVREKIAKSQKYFVAEVYI